MGVIESGSIMKRFNTQKGVRMIPEEAAQCPDIILNIQKGMRFEK